MGSTKQTLHIYRPFMVYGTSAYSITSDFPIRIVRSLPAIGGEWLAARDNSLRLTINGKGAFLAIEDPIPPYTIFPEAPLDCNFVEAFQNKLSFEIQDMVTSWLGLGSDIPVLVRGVTAERLPRTSVYQNMSLRNMEECYLEYYRKTPLVSKEAVREVETDKLEKLSVDIRGLWIRQNAHQGMQWPMPRVDLWKFITRLALFGTLSVPFFEQLRSLVAPVGHVGLIKLRFVKVYLDCECLRPGRYTDVREIGDYNEDDLDIADGWRVIAEQVLQGGPVRFKSEGELVASFGIYTWEPSQQTASPTNIAIWHEVIDFLRSTVYFNTAVDVADAAEEAVVQSTMENLGKEEGIGDDVDMVEDEGDDVEMDEDEGEQEEQEEEEDKNYVLERLPEEDGMQHEYDGSYCRLK